MWFQYKKHLVEKRRRNRVNNSLDQLKAMVLEASSKDVSLLQFLESITTFIKIFS